MKFNKLRNFGLAALTAVALSGCSKESNPVAPPVPPVENIAPDTFITGYTTNGRSVTFTFYGTDSDGTVAKYKYTHDGISSWPETTQKTVTLNNVIDGSHFFMAASVDNKGLQDSSPAYRQFTMNYQPPVDTQAPETVITSGPTGTINYNNVSFQVTGLDNVTSTPNLKYIYRLSPLDSQPSSPTTSTTPSYNGLENRVYTLYAQAVDVAGNIDQSPASRTFTVNVSNPNPEFLDIIADYPIANLVAGRDIAIDGQTIWFIGGTTLEKRNLSDLSLIASYSLSNLDRGIPNLTSGFTGIAILDNGIAVHASTSKYFYKLSKTNPNTINSTVIVPEGDTRADVYDMEEKGNYILMLDPGHSQLITTDSNFNRIGNPVTFVYQDYYPTNLVYDGSNLWALAFSPSSFEHGNFVSKLFKLDSNMTPISEYPPFEYDTPGVYMDGPGPIDIANGYFWSASALPSPTLHKHYFGNN